MGRGAVEEAAKERFALSSLTQRNRELIRIALVPLFVLVCYEFGWGAWRDAVCAAFVGFAHLLRMPVFRVAPGHVCLPGPSVPVRDCLHSSGCVCGVDPAVVDWEEISLEKPGFFAEYFGVLSAVNLVRLAAGLWIFLHGVSWWISHEAFAGVFYFVFFLWIADRRRWSLARTRETALAAGVTN